MSDDARTGRILQRLTIVWNVIEVGVTIGLGVAAASLALVEPGPLFDPLLPRVQAEPKGDDAFVLSGAKSFVPMGDRASHFLVIARNDGVRDAFIVPRDAEGLTISEPEKNPESPSSPNSHTRSS